MNPVVSYKDLMNYMFWSSNNKNQLLPVILIKPSIMLFLNREHRLDRIFSYFNRRSGQEVQFFLPGYAHYPSTAFSEFLPDVHPDNENAIALKIDFRRKIYYSDDDFINFVELIEKETPSFCYYGSTELLLIKYIAGDNGELGKFDFNTIYQFNLSQLYYSHQEHFYHIELFLEEVLHAMREEKKTIN